ncbi:methyltransferase [Sphingomonas sinipercae]|uniref:Methyltransferase n=1 Tax=Sphingomonas sinipercae TaxID=2714944 RepID=A0A6G7ZQ31_9SPHN|nr:methyltransferase [Sphingomonas sinipercae]QIL03010.1 methyltransferase [Sphingomonas sinipercae]
MVTPLGELLERLRQRDYQFTAITPLTHRRVLERPWDGPATLRDIFGWSRPFDRQHLPADLLELLEQAGALGETSGKLGSKVRVASLDADLFVHSAFPTERADSVFFGPDTYRFARFLKSAIPALPTLATSIVDMGAGSGAGGIVAARLLRGARLTLVDVNPAALELAAVNAAAAGIDAQLVESDRIPPADLVVANPPYLIDPAKRAYRDGGDLLGGAVALEWARQAIANGSTMLLYTGAAFTADAAPLIEALAQDCAAAGASLTVEDLDPDVFGEELDQPAYADVERIAAIGAVIRPAAATRN